MRCSECKLERMLHSPEVSLCEDCYIELFRTNDGEAHLKHESVVHSEVVDGGELEFELEHEVAEVKNSNDSVCYVDGKPIDGKNIFLSYNSVGLRMSQPKQMVFNPDCRVKDYDKLILFLLENMAIYDNAKGFNKVRYMFKEAE